MPRKISNSFVGGKIVNYRGTKEYIVEGIGLVTFKVNFVLDLEQGNVTFKVNKNLSIYDVNPRKVVIGDEEHDVLSVVNGQVPDAGANTLANHVSKWYADAERYAS